MAPCFHRFLPLFNRTGRPLFNRTGRKRRQDRNTHLVRGHNASILTTFHFNLARLRHSKGRRLVNLVDVMALVQQTGTSHYNLHIAYLLSIMLRLQHQCFPNALDHSFRNYEQRGDVEGLCLLACKLQNVRLAHRAACWLDRYRIAHGDVLYRLGHISERVKILKHTEFRSKHWIQSYSYPSPVEKRSTSLGLKCTTDVGARYVCVCAICENRVRGLTSFCCRCAHGGHHACCDDWFSINSTCPAPGCGCQCAISLPPMLTCVMQVV